MKFRPAPPCAIGEQHSQESLLYQLERTYRQREKEGSSSESSVEQLTQRLAGDAVEIVRLRQTLAELTDEEKMDPVRLRELFGDAFELLEEYAATSDNIQRFKGSTKES